MIVDRDDEEEAGLGLEPERYELDAGLPYRFAVSRRDAFKALGGGGLVVLLLAREAEGQQSPQAPSRGRGGGGGGGGGPRQLSAWLHIAEDGAVTVYTGKVEVGQDARTSLTQAVAEELAVAPSAIRLVMGDTAVCPFDAGTFGSRTTPAMAPQLRRVAASARETLRDLAARTLGVERGTLLAAEGIVSHPPSKRALRYGEITRGQKLVDVVVAENVALTPPAQWRVLGKPLPQVDGRAAVTGRRRYTSDLTRPGMLRGKIARPPRYGARLENVDSRRAGGVPGAQVVRDGDFLGAVAPDEETAARALAACRVQWSRPDDKERPVSSKDLFQRLRGAGTPGEGGGGDERREGDLAAGFAAGKHRLEQTYTAAYIAHAPLEPRAALAEWTRDEAGGGGERLTVWTGTQRPFGVRRELAEAFRLPEERVHVVAADTGSGYGGKHSGEAAIEAARLARAAGKPVKLTWTREEEFTWAYFRPAGVIDIRSAVAADGKLTAWQVRNFNSGTAGLRTPYAVANHEHHFQRVTSPLKQGSYRALASTANHFARETHMDELARLAELDPLEMRERNLTDARLRAVLQTAAERFRWGARKGSAVGLACGLEKGGYVATCAEVVVEPPQVRVLRLVTAFECGAVVNPDGLRNQIEGSLIMGLGGALFEAIEFGGGRIANPRFSGYRVPRFGDVPALETVLVDRKDLPSAGAGESPIVAVAPAIGNAIFAATGKRLRGLPMRP